MTIETFIREFRHDDVRKLALLGHRYPDLDLPFALDQIEGWQTARTKLPSWAEREGIVYPPHISMEQCSSEATARYKATVADSGGLMADLTGGFGVDFSFMARGFERAFYVERQPHLCDIARRNFAALGLSRAEIVCAEAEDFLSTMPHADLIYLDPARRDEHGNKTYAIEDCTPNVQLLASALLEKANRVMIKLSPMLDWHKAASSLGNVSEVHIVSSANECKELLLVLESQREGFEPRVFCVNDQQTTVFDACDVPTPLFSSPTLVGRTLLVPNASIMKSGLFGQFCEQFHAAQIAKNSNLFILGDAPLDETSIPARRFLVERVTTLNKTELKAALKGIDRANIAARNFPLSATDLRRRLKLKDGGGTYIFATTIATAHILLICSKKAQ